MGSVWSDSADGSEDCAKVISYLTEGDGSGQAYHNLGEFVDTFGSRIAGSERLEAAIAHVEKQLQDSGLSVHTENFEIDGWRRGEEEAHLLQPFEKKLPLLGLGTTVPTPDSGIEAECIVVESFDELDSVKEKVPGKIVVFNQSWVNYGASVLYRTKGASHASKYGAVASLIRSVTPFSIGSPHTGMQEYASEVKKIPTACITVEDAEMMLRQQQRGQQLRVRLRITSSPCQSFTSRNIVADLVGSELPEEAIVLCGHIDSWDVGQGAMDDGGGFFCARQAIAALQALSIRTKRTIRLVVFSGEEFGIYGGSDFYRRHREDMGPKLSFMLESDSGTFSPVAISFNGSDAAFQQMQKVVQLMQPLGKIELVRGEGGPDITSWANASVPIGEIVAKRSGEIPDFYFNFHHTEGDMLTVQNPAEMDKCAAVFAVVAVALGNAPGMLPR